MKKIETAQSLRSTMNALSLCAAAIAGTMIGMFVVDDASTFYSVVNNDKFCCGYVSEHWYERPITYSMIDSWTPPVWQQNAIGTERWLVSDGIVNGKKKFWKIIQRETI